jgi:predicted transcriptional regulator
MELMKIKDILNASVLCGEEHLHLSVKSVCSSDLMSDVLAFAKSESMLLTGLVNPQTVRTADMMDMKCIVFVRGKIPDVLILKMADERGITIMSSEHSMFAASGHLFSSGLEGI